MWSLFSLFVSVSMLFSSFLLSLSECSFICFGWPVQINLIFQPNQVMYPDISLTMFETLCTLVPIWYFIWLKVLVGYRGCPSTSANWLMLLVNNCSSGSHGRLIKLMYVVFSSPIRMMQKNFLWVLKFRDKRFPFLLTCEILLK